MDRSLGACSSQYTRPPRAELHLVTGFSVLSHRTWHIATAPQRVIVVIVSITKAAGSLEFLVIPEAIFAPLSKS